MTIAVKDAASATQTIQTLDDLAKNAGAASATTLRTVASSNDPGVVALALLATAEQVGEVQASPTANTLLDRLKALLTGVILAAGSNIVGKVGIDQTTPGATNLVAAGQSGTWTVENVSGTVSLPTGAATSAKQPELGTAGTASSDVISVQGIASGTALSVSVGASTSEIGRTNIRHVMAQASALTRPANTTAYAANDSISDNATAGSVTANVVTVSDTNDDPVNLTQVLMTSADTAPGVAGTFLRLHLFNSDPTASSGVVGGDNAAYSNKQAGWVGSFTGQMVAFSDGSRGVLVPDGPPVMTVSPATGARTMWWQLQTLGAFTPSANSTTFTPKFRGYQGRV